MDEIELIKIEVGKKFPLYKDSVEKLVGRDGAFFEASEFNQGYQFCVHLTNITFTDKQSFLKDKINMRLLLGGEGLVLPMVKFGKSLIFEMHFNPTLYDDERALQFVDTNNMLTMFLIESNNGILKAIRQCNLPLKMIQICKEAWGKALLDPNYNEKYEEWLKRTSSYSLETLWERATKVGRLGESYDIKDIKIPNQYKPKDDI